MEKTKIGVSVPVAAALSFLVFPLLGVTAGILFLGFVLVCESSAALKRSALSATIIYIAFALLTEVLGLIPDGFNLIEEFVRVCDGTLNVSEIDEYWYLLRTIINYARDIVFLILAFKAWKGKAVEIGFVKKLVD